MSRQGLICFGVSLAVCLLAAPSAMAQTSACGIDDGNNALDCVIETFQTATRGWEASLAQLAIQLFWLLAAIEFSWAAISLALRGADLSEWMSGLLNQILFLGFFAALLQFSSVWAEAIIASFREAANLAGGVAVIRPSDIFDVGLRLGTMLLADLSVLSPVFSLVLILAAFFLVIAFGLIAATLIVALVESFIIISANVLFMGFGGSRWTKDYAVRTFQYCVSVGAKLFIVQLLAGLMIAIIEPWSSIEAQQLTQSWTFLLVPLGIAMVFIVLVRTIPELVQGLINGTSLSTGAGLYASATGFAAGAATASVATSMATRSGAKLASEQLKDAELGGRAHASLPIAFAGRTAANITGAALSNVGARLSGRVPPHGTFTGQMSAEMDRRREGIREARNKPQPKADATETPSSPNRPPPERTKSA